MLGSHNEVTANLLADERADISQRTFKKGNFSEFLFTGGFNGQVPLAYALGFVSFEEPYLRTVALSIIAQPLMGRLPQQTRFSVSKIFTLRTAQPNGSFIISSKSLIQCVPSKIGT